MKTFKFFAIAWVIALAIFNAITFICIPDGSITSGLIAGYICITVAFIGLLLCGFVALKEKNINKKFYSMPIVTESYVGLIMMLIFGSATMILQIIPQWPGIIICLLILGLTALSVIKVSANAEIVADIDVKIADDTAFMKNLTREAELLISQAKSEELKAECVKVYEALRYAPKRVDANRQAEIKIKFDEFKNAVNSVDNENEVNSYRELIFLINH